jgi:hypothetical protein
MIFLSISVGLEVFKLKQKYNKHLAMQHAERRNEPVAFPVTFCKLGSALKSRYVDAMLSSL